MNDPLLEERDNQRLQRRTSAIVTTQRVFKVPIPEPNHYKPNKISTCKYNCITFLPKNLWEQFKKLANIYFIIVAILQSIPQISISGGVPNILMPLTLVLSVSAIKDLLEDLKRRRSDKEENMRYTLKRHEGDWVNVRWQNVKVGDIVKVNKDEFFPADILLLSSSDVKGICYIETKNLDGETNLKHKLAHKESHEMFQNPANYDNFQSQLRCEDPNPAIYVFNGLIQIANSTVPVGNEQFLLRGSSLKNTEWITGLVVYTGHESKIMLNSSKSRKKFSSLELQMNRQIVFIFLMQLALCSGCAAYYAIWFKENKGQTYMYLDLDYQNNDPLVAFVIQFFTWMLIFTNFVPISLIVTLEMVKYLQAVFIAWDLQLYYEPNDISAGVQSSNLNEELGQISYVFSDKTGTLTCNIMEFRKLSINGISYGTDSRFTGPGKIPHVDFVDPRFDPREEHAIDVMILLATCHTIITEEKEGKIIYKASSPDELALVNCAKFFGYEFIGRDANLNAMVRIQEDIIKIQILNVLEFTSDRKRMSVVVRLPNGKIKIFCKGADTILKPKLVNTDVIDKTWQNLEDYANEGLRTLVLASRDLTESEYQEWNAKFVEAMQDILNREQRIGEVGELIETSLTLLGATAIEDKLQDKVPETIQKLRNAGVKVWVLTGDKMETAINIGFSCNLLTSDMVRIIVQGSHTEDVTAELNQGIKAHQAEPNVKFALVITGESLFKAMRGDNKALLLKVSDFCNVVLACRVTPQQKADIVKLIKDNKKGAKTLSIGDGANDVNMITAAHVGIGIAGLEGAQAVRASDYSIGQFSYLQRLMFVHGRESYRKNSTLICYNFYKNVLLVMPLFFYGIFSAFSGQPFYNTWLYQLYNMIFTAMPICIYAMFDREIPYEVLGSEPKYYKIGLKGELFSTDVFWAWILEAVLQSAIIVGVGVWAICYVSGLKETGLISGMWTASVLVYGLVVVFANIKVILFSYSHFWFSLTVIFISILCFFLSTALITELLPLLSWLDNYEGKGTLYKLLVNPNTYISIVVLIYGGFFIQPVIRRFKLLRDLSKSKPLEAVAHAADEESSVSSEESDQVPEVLPPDEMETAQQALYQLRRRHTGFAFSGEAGHAPQLTDPNFFFQRNFTQGS